jgi:hypothetical protein
MNRIKSFPIIILLLLPFCVFAQQIEVTPRNISLSTPIGGTATKLLKIKNNGSAVLNWNMLESEPTAQAMRIGGPDNAGYVYIDSNEPGGPAFEWHDISTIGIGLTLNDESFSEIRLFFPFTFYGQTFTSVQVSANGFLTFGPQIQQRINPAIPNSAAPNAVIAPFWDDLISGGGMGAVFAYEDLVNRQVIIQFNDVRRAGDPNTRITFQIILRENNDILFQYLAATGTLNSATIGIENLDGSDGLQVAFNEAYVTDSLAVRFTPGCDWLSTNFIGGTLQPGDSTEVLVTADAGNLTVGDYLCNLIVSSNALNEPQITIPVNFTVGIPNIAVFPDTLDFGQQLLGTSDTLQTTVSNIGDVPLFITGFGINGIGSSSYRLLDNSLFFLQPGESKSISVIFEPVGTGPKPAELTIFSNDPDQPATIVSLRGISVTPDITVTPTAVNFGNVVLGDTLFSEVIITNFGTADLVVDAITLSGNDASNFSITPNLPIILTRFESDTVAVAFTPVSDGLKSAQLNIFSNDPDENPVTVSLSGTGISPNIVISPTSVDFGEVVLGQSAIQTILIENTGSAPLEIFETSLSGTDSAEFAIVNGGSITIPPSANYNLQVSFTPQTLGNKSASVTIFSNDADQPGISIPLSATARGIPDITVIPLTIDFGVVPVGQSALGTFLVTNDGNDVLTGLSEIVGNTVDFSFEFGGGNFNLAPGDTNTIGVRFEPHQLGMLFTVLKITSNDPDEAIVPVTIFGTSVIARIQVDPLQVNFGNVPIDTSATETVNITNTGTYPFTVSATELTGTNATNFSLPGLQAPFTVDPNETKQIDVRFSPQTLGTKSATLQILTDAFNADTVTVTLSGTGVGEPDIDVSPLALDFGNTLVGDTTNSFAIINNVGELELFINSIAISGANASEFFIIRMPNSTLQPGESDTLQLSFIPQSIGSKTAIVTINSNDPDENPVVLQLSGVGAAADIAFDNPQIDFGKVFVGNTSDTTLSVINIGNTPLVISDIQLNGPNENFFNVVLPQLPVSVSPGDSLKLPINYTPGDNAIHSALIEFQTNIPGAPVAAVPLSGDGVTPIISIVPDTLDFGTVQVADTSLGQLILRNEGDTTLIVQQVDLTGSTPGAFALATGLPIAIEAGSSDTVVVRFIPPSAALFEAVAIISGNDPFNPTVAVTLTGSGSFPPTIRLSRSAINFGAIQPGDSVQQELTIYNDGTIPLTIALTAITDSSGAIFELLSPSNLVIPPLDSALVAIQFKGFTAGDKRGQLQISSNDPNVGQLIVSLSGTVNANQIGVFPATLAFGDVSLGDTSTIELKVFNSATANTPVTVSQLYFDGYSMPFSIISGNAPFTLSPGDTQLVTLGFSPTRFNMATSSLVIISDDIVNNHIVLPASGTGVLKQFDEYIFVANERISYEQFLRVDGSMYSNDAINIHLGIGGRQTGNAYSKREFQIFAGNTFEGDIVYGDKLRIEGQHIGTVTKDPNLPAIPFPNFTTLSGSSDLVVARGDTIFLQPGAYRNVTVSGTLYLSSGSYDFHTLDFEANAHLIADVSSGIVDVYIANKANFGQSVLFSLLPNGEMDTQKFILATQQSADLEIKQNSRILGSIYAPFSRVELGRNSIFKGAIMSKRVKMKRAIFAVSHHSAEILPKDSLSLAKQFAGLLTANLPKEFSLAQNYPNPFNPTTTIVFTVPSAVNHYSLKIYDIKGSLVRTIGEGQLAAGRYEVIWDGLTDYGSRAASGIYIYRMVADRFSDTKKMVLIK